MRSFKMEDSHSNNESIERERSSSENVTIIAETFSNAARATVSSIKSEDSTEHLICKTPQNKNMKNKVDTRSAITDKNNNKNLNRKLSVKISNESLNYSKSLEASLECEYKSVKKERSKYVLFLGLSQLLIGICIVVFGALVIVKNASLSRVGAGLWSGCIAIATGMVGILAGISDCYGGMSKRGNPFLTAFLALSLASLAAGNMAAVLAGTGIYRDTHGNRLPNELEGDMEEEKAAWTPVLANIVLLITSIIHCALSITSIYHASKRVCTCFRPKEQFNHNQFDPNYKSGPVPYIVTNDKSPKRETIDRTIGDELCKDLERKLNGSDCEKMRKIRRISDVVKEGHGSANSKDRLVNTWLQTGSGKAVKVGKVRKMKMKPQPIMLVPAHAGSTLGRGVPIQVVPIQPRYATLPIMQAPPHSTTGVSYRTAPIYCQMPTAADMTGGRRRRRSPRRSRGGQQSRDNRLTRSLERIHRKAKKEKPVTEADVIRTYTGLDRVIAEQFIEACDETRQVSNNSTDKTDSSGFDTASSECHSNRF